MGSLDMVSDPNARRLCEQDADLSRKPRPTGVTSDRMLLYGLWYCWLPGATIEPRLVKEITS